MQIGIPVLAVGGCFLVAGREVFGAT